MSKLLERTSAPARMADLEPDIDGLSNVRSANLPNFSIVDVIPLPISAALLANSDRAPFLEPLPSPMGDPFAACLCDSVSSDCLCDPTLVDDCLFCACARTARNSAVLSCMEDVAIENYQRLAHDRASNHRLFAPGPVVYSWLRVRLFCLMLEYGCYPVTVKFLVCLKGAGSSAC